MNKNKKVLIANAQGFWGDSPLGPLRLIEEGPVDYLTFDYLAEITMSIMQKEKMRNPDAGYATDFVRLVGRIIKTCKQKNIKIIANAGGGNLKACLNAVTASIADQGIKGIKIGIVEGDDILEQLPLFKDEVLLERLNGEGAGRAEPSTAGDETSCCFTFPDSPG